MLRDKLIGDILEKVGYSRNHARHGALLHKKPTAELQTTLEVLKSADQSLAEGMKIGVRSWLATAGGTIPPFTTEESQQQKLLSSAKLRPKVSHRGRL